MLFKEADDRTAELDELEKLAALGTRDQQKRINEQRRNLQAGIKAEQQSTYLIDFYLKDSNNTGVIHDLRLEINGRIAQIDHLLVTRSMEVFVIETKGAHAGIKITEEGEFLRWNNFTKSYEGMPSPIAQNARHIAVLGDAFNAIELPRRLGIRLTPNIHSLVVLDPKARIDRPKNVDTSMVIKADVLVQTMEKILDRKNLITSLAHIVSQETVGSICQQLVRLHKPATFNYRARFGIAMEEATAPSSRDEREATKEVAKPPADPVASAPEKTPVPEGPAAPMVNEGPMICSHCDSHDGSPQHGRYGWYWKCKHCDKNTRLNFTCAKDGAIEAIRQTGSQYFRECPTCGGSTLFHTSPWLDDERERTSSTGQQSEEGAGKASPTAPAAAEKSCRHCSSPRGSIQYGRFGYYWKCAECDKNTPLRIGCGTAECGARIRKDKLKFFVECAKCGTSVLFHTNEANPECEMDQ